METPPTVERETVMFDLVGRETVTLDLTGRDIHAEAARLRAIGPVAPLQLPGGVRAWSVTGQEAGRQVLADERFSKDPRQHWTAYANGEIDPDFPLIAWARMENLTSSYGDEHSRQRRLVLTAFSPRRVQAMRPMVTRAVARLLDDLGRQAPGPIDLKAAFAQPLAATVIGDLIGVPETDRVGLLGDGYAAGHFAVTPQEAAASFLRLRQRMTDLIAAKRREPGDDLCSDLIAARDQGARLTEDEILSTLLLLLNTGTEPATNLVTNAVAALLTHPEQRAMVFSGQLPWSDVVEETLRVQAPVAHLPFRFAVEDVPVGDVVIPRGEPVLVNFAGMGRDPAVHGATADRFDVTRTDKQHLSFGHGSYRCLGAALAWLEVELALTGLFDRFPAMVLAVPADELAPQGGFVMNGLSRLPLYLSGHDG